MPDLLLLSTDSQTSQAIAEQAREIGYRVKAVDNEKSALGWASSQPFDLALIGVDFKLDSVGRVSQALWAMNPTTPVIVFNLATPQNLGRDRIELTIMGVDLIEGLDAAERIKLALKKTSEKKKMGSAKFEVLVVEDLDSPRDIICAFVEHIGYPTVKGVNSADLALKELEADPHHFQCVITDINMPGVNGKQLIELIRKHKKLQHLPIVVLTAYGTADNLIECLDAGASGFLVKPPTKASLNRELGRAMRLIQNNENPRLVKAGDAAQLREILATKGFQ